MFDERVTRSVRVLRTLGVGIILISAIACSDSKPGVAEIESVLNEELIARSGSATALEIESVTKTTGRELDAFGQQAYEIEYLAEILAHEWVTVSKIGRFGPDELVELESNMAFGKTDNGWEVINIGNYITKTLTAPDQDASAAIGKWAANFTVNGVPKAPKLTGVIDFDSNEINLLAESNGKTRTRTGDLEVISDEQGKLEFQVSYDVNGRSQSVNYSAVINGSNISGTWADGRTRGQFTGQRQ